MVNYPTTLDTFTNIDQTDTMEDSGIEHDVVHNNEQDAIEALEAKVGVDNSTVTTTLDYKLRTGANPGHTHTLAYGATDITASAAELNKNDGVTEGTVSASKVVVVDSSKNIDFGTGSVTATNATASTLLTATTRFDFAILRSASWGGWYEANETWTRTAATTFTISGDKTSKYAVGTAIKLTDTTTKYFYITAISYGSPTTTVTVNGGSDYSLVGAITNPYFAEGYNAAGWPGLFNYTATPGGFSVAPTVTSKFMLTGRKVTVFYYTSSAGTSNANTFTVLAPIISSSDTFIAKGASFDYVDNGANVQTVPALLSMGASTTTITLTKTMGSALWTVTGNKFANFTFDYYI
jgi:hypothetical protein